MSLMHLHNQNKPGLVSMSHMINLASLKIYTDLQQLVEVIKSQGDSERKTEIVNFLSTSRSLLIRVQGLNKWTTSAIKVDKCDKISNLLDEQSSLLFCTARLLSILARDKLPNARLPNSMPIIAADIFTTKTYSRLPNHIRLSVLQTKPICQSDKLRMFDELNRILRIRLSNSRIPYRMRNINIKHGRVKFRVENEFEVICTLMSDHFESPWRILNINFLVKGNEICRGRSLVHKNHLKDVHRQVQSRLQIAHSDNYNSLYHLYDMLHSMSLSLQLEVLNEQLHKYSNFSKGLNIINITYVRGYKLSFSYWQVNENIINRVLPAVTIAVDDEDSRRPLKLKHTPSFISNEFRSEYAIDSSNLSITNIILQTITARIYSCLKMIEKMLLPFVSDTYKITKDEPILKIPILSNVQTENVVKIMVKRSNGIIECRLDLSIDFLPNDNRVRIKQLMHNLTIKLNELYMKTVNHSKYFESTENASDTMENREIIIIRRQIVEYFSKLKVVIAAYGCFNVLQRAGLHDLQFITNKPNLMIGNEFSSSTLSSLLKLEAKSECELVYIPLSNSSEKYLVISCEIRHRNRAYYRFFHLSTSEMYNSHSTGFYSRKSWVRKPNYFVYVDQKRVKRALDYGNKEDLRERTDNSNDIGSDSSSILTCHDLLKRRFSQDPSLNFMKNELDTKVGQNEKSPEPDDLLLESDINALPYLINYFQKSTYRNEFCAYLVSRNFSILKNDISDVTNLLSCHIHRFPEIKSCSQRINILMNKIIRQAIIFDINESIVFYDVSEARKWKINMILASPVVYIKQWLHGDFEASKTISISKEFDCLADVKTNMDAILNYWEQLCQFTEVCILQLFRKDPVGKFRITHFDFQTIEMCYGSNSEYTLCVNSPQKLSGNNQPSHLNQPPSKIPNTKFRFGGLKDNLENQNNFTIELRCKRQIGVKHSEFAGLNPHNLIKRHLERRLNENRDLYDIVKLMDSNTEFLNLFIPYNDKSIVATASSINSPDNINSSSAIPITSGGTNTNSENADSSVPASLSNVSNTMSKNNSVELLRKYILIFSESNQVDLVYRERFVLRIIYDASRDVVVFEDAVSNFHACNMSIHAMPMFDNFVSVVDGKSSGIKQLSRLLCRKSGMLESYFETCFKMHGRKVFSIAIPTMLLNPTLSNSSASTTTNASAPQKQDRLLHPILGVHIKMIYDETSLKWTVGISTDTHVNLEPITKDKSHSNEEKTLVSQNNSPKDSTVEDGEKIQEFVTLIENFFRKKIKEEKCILGVSRIHVFRTLLLLPSLRLQKNLFTILTQDPMQYEKAVSVDSAESRAPTSWTIRIDLDWTCLRTEPIICQKQDSSSIYLRFVVVATCNSTPDKPSSQNAHRIWLLSMHYAAKSNDISLLEDGTDSTIVKLGIDKQVNEIYLVSDDDTDTPIPSFFVNLLEHVKQLL